jgi:hypothetical protein
MKTFETNSFLMIVNNDLLIEFKVKKNTTLQATDIWESRDLSVNYLPYAKFMVLMETEENVDISGDARRAGASKEYGNHVSALALYSTKLHETIIGNLFLKINKPFVPTKFFDDRIEAITWLKEVAKKAQL